jgi:hypothetical protein
MAEGVLGMECLSPWELCEGNLEGGPLLGTPKDIWECLWVGICLHRGSSFGEPGGGIVYRGL